MGQLRSCSNDESGQAAQLNPTVALDIEESYGCGLHQVTCDLPLALVEVCEVDGQQVAVRAGPYLTGNPWFRRFGSHCATTSSQRIRPACCSLAGQQRLTCSVPRCKGRRETRTCRSQGFDREMMSAAPTLSLCWPYRLILPDQELVHDQEDRHVHQPIDRRNAERSMSQTVT